MGSGAKIRIDIPDLIKISLGILKLIHSMVIA